MCWIVNNLDRFLSFVAIILAVIGIVIAVVAMVDVRNLFQKLEERDKNTEKRVHRAVLKELLTHTASFAAFCRAAQFIDFYSGQPNEQTAIAMLMSFRLQQLLAPDAKPEEMAKLRQDTREKMEKTAAEYTKLIVASGIGKVKDGWELSDVPK